MPNISEKVKEQYIQEVLSVIRDAARRKQLFEEFMTDILTPEEIEKLALRWQIVKKLNQNETQRDVARDMKVSIGTITRGARMLRNQAGGFNRYLTGKKQ